MPSIRPMHTGCGSMCMDVYKVKIYPAAKQDLSEIIDHLNTLSPSAALRYYDLLTEQIAGLSHMPERWPRPKDLALAVKGYRCLVVESYLVFYVVTGDTVQIRRILFGRRNYKDSYSTKRRKHSVFPPFILATG